MDRESQKAQDARVRALWETLDTKKEGRLDLAGLRRGLWKMDHPLKNADSLLRDVMSTVDTNGDGKISFQEFEKFVKSTERELSSLFNSIDRDHNGKLDKGELSGAFLRAGLLVPQSKLDQFFDEVDTNNDGVITFDEWRDFLLFIPDNMHDLQSVISYFTSTLKMSPEGDVTLSDETIEGLGTPLTFLLDTFLGAIVRIARVPPKREMLGPPADVALAHVSGASYGDVGSPHASLAVHSPLGLIADADAETSGGADVTAALQSDFDWTTWEHVKPMLIELLPKPGYFLAGGLAGIVSRTTTAPLDRLKVYLIAQTGVAKDAVHAAKSGAPAVAASKFGQHLIQACRELWKAGGMRSLFAGNGLNVVKVMPESAVKFGSYEAAKRTIAQIEGHGDPKRIAGWSKFVAGGIGGIVSQFVVYPLDTLKFRMQCETVEGGLHGNALIIQTAKRMWVQDGFRSFYRGLPMGLIGMFPYAAIDLGTFEFLKKQISLYNSKKLGVHERDAEPGGIATAAIGGFSGAFGASIVYPLNLLRTRLQSQGTAIHPRRYTGIWDVTKQTIQGEGFRGLFKGLTPNLLKVVPAVSITYVVYEKSKAALSLH